jgi:uracil-DNA glycosylase
MSIPASGERGLSFEPEPDCPLCPRLARFRSSLRATKPGWHNAPVPMFGACDAALLVIGLAPGLNGANRTGRPFTGDFAGDLLYKTLIEFEFAVGAYRATADDGLRLSTCAITNAVRCVPPQNKPLPSEINNCRPFLSATVAALPSLRVIVALGRIAHETVLRSFGLKPAAFPFAHGAEHVLSASNALCPPHQANPRALTLIDSYHCSRYNTNTGVLTADMFRAVFVKARASLRCP